MNTGLDRHVPYQTWEDFARGKLPAQECIPLEEHLLVCPACQDILAGIDEYIEVVKAAAALLEAGQAKDPAQAKKDKPVTDSRTRRRISKATARATSA